MSDLGKDLQQAFDDLAKAFGQGDVSQAAREVSKPAPSGKVRIGPHAGSRTAGLSPAEFEAAIKAGLPGDMSEHSALKAPSPAKSSGIMDIARAAGGQVIEHQPGKAHSPAELEATIKAGLPGDMSEHPALKAPSPAKSSGIMDIARAVGGRVIENQPGNAHDITRMLTGAGGAPQENPFRVQQTRPGAWSVLGSVGQTIGSYPSQAAANQAAAAGATAQAASPAASKIGAPPQPQGYSGTLSALHAAASVESGSGSREGPTGSRSKPFTIEFTTEAVRNLATQIAQASKTGGKPEGSWQKFLPGFAKSYGRAAQYSPLRQGKEWLGKKIRNMLGGGEDSQPAGKQDQPENAVLDIARRNAQRMAQFAKDEMVPGGQDPFGTMLGKARDVANAARGSEIDSLEKFPAGDSKGYSQIIKPPPMPGQAPGAAGAAPPLAGEAAAGEGAGLAGLGEAAGSLAGGLLGTATVAGEVVVAYLGLTTALKAFGEATVEGNRHLSKWNGQLAIQNALGDIAAIRREAHMAQATGGSSSLAASETRKLADEFQPIAEELAGLKNLVATSAVEVARLLTLIWKLCDTTIGPVLRAIEKYLGSGNQGLPLEGLFDFFEHNARLQNARNPGPVVGARAMRPGGAGGGGGMAPGARNATRAAKKQWAQQMDQAADPDAGVGAQLGGE